MKKLFFLAFALLAVNLSATAKKPLAGHVVMIAFDGWGAYCMPKAQNIPNIKALMESGCWTLKKRSVLPSSSAINWASMFNGCPTEVHGYTQWNSRRPEIPSRWESGHGIIPTIYTLMQQQMPSARTACLYEWSGIKYLIDTLAVTHHAQANNCEKDPAEIVGMAENCIRNEKPTFLSVCFDGIDHVGHGIGHDTPEYYAKLTEYDGYVGRIMKAVKEAYGDDFIVLMSSDHGGVNKGHGGKSLLELETPFIISGKNVKASGEFQESMMQYDTAATIAYIFGLEQPQVWVGRAMKQVFKK